MPRYEHAIGTAYALFFEAERDGLTVRTCSGDAKKHRSSEKTYPTEDAARFAYGRAIHKHTSTGFTLVGPSQKLTPPEPEPIGSSLLADEYFAQADARFDAEILRVQAGGKLAAFAARWIADARPWARRALLAYIDDGCDRPEHKGLVKRLFKHFEKAADDEVMAHFLVAFDSLGGRLLVTEAGSTALRTDPLIPSRLGRRSYDKRPPVVSPRFSRASRTYLARRAYRYFRKLGFGDPPRYARALRLALPLYRDDRLDTAAKLLDAWGLLHALYHDSAALEAGTHAWRLADEAKLSDLRPAPHFPDVWRGVFAELYAMLLAARSQTVRAWTIAWLREHYAAELAKLPVAQVVAFLTSPHEEMQQLGAHLLPSVAGLETLPIATWLELLAIDSTDVVEIVCQVVAKHVAPARLSLAQCVALASGPAAPVARLGLQWARGKKLDSAADLRAIAQLGKARVPSVRDEASAWASQAIAGHPKATPEHLRDLVDAPHGDAREHALAAVATADQLATPALWLQLTESPYDDVRKIVVANAERWRAAAEPATLVHVWTSALLAVHRGSRTKARVPRAIAERIAAVPAEAPTLLPLLAYALRSVRPPERASAIAALARAIRADATVRALAHALIPELAVGDEVTA